MRIRWRGVGRAAAIVVVALIGMRLLPDLLRAPEPPPLGADVGLPKAKPAAASRPVVPEPTKPGAPAPKHPSKRRPTPVAVPDAPASTARIGTRTRRPKHRRRVPHRVKEKRSPPPEPTPESTPPPAPEYVPPPAAEAAPEPVPEPPPDPPSTPGDGSQEFAPR